MPIRTNQLKKDEAPAKKAGRKSRKSLSTKKKPSGQRTSIFAFLKDERFLKTIGFFLILSAFYLLLCLVSYLVNWFTGGSDDLFSTIPFREVLFNDDIIANNWGGRFGAALGGLFIKKWFGAPSLLISFFLFVWGYKLLFRKAILPVWKTFRWSLIAMLWLSLAFAFIFINSELRILGGVAGLEINNYLDGFIGRGGVQDWSCQVQGNFS